MPDGTDGDGIGRVDEMDRAGESGEVLYDPPLSRGYRGKNIKMAR